MLQSRGQAALSICQKMPFYPEKGRGVIFSKLCIYIIIIKSINEAEDNPLG